MSSSEMISKSKGAHSSKDSQSKILKEFLLNGQNHKRQLQFVDPLTLPPLTPNPGNGCPAQQTQVILPLSELNELITFVQERTLRGLPKSEAASSFPKPTASDT